LSHFLVTVVGAGVVKERVEMRNMSSEENVTEVYTVHCLNK
jgi:hypothetical protein